jgi:hypothetical protein
MCSIPDIELVEAKWRLGVLEPKAMSDIATALLVQGCNLREVMDVAAGRVDEKDYWFRFGDILSAVLGRESVAGSRAGWLVARHLASEMLIGNVEPEQGIKEVLLLTERMDEGYSCVPAWILGFYNLADDWETVFWNRPDDYRAEILHECRHLLDLPEPADVHE